jgi:hypothetical protein
LADIPWFNSATPEQRAGIEAEWAKCQPNMSLAEYVNDASEWPSAEAYLADAGWKPNPVVAAMVDHIAADVEVVPQKASEIYAKYAAAVQNYAVSESKGQLEVGRLAHEYILAQTKGETDAGVRKGKRAQARKRCDGELADAGIHPADSDKCIRLWAIASVYGKAEARKLGIGKLRAFESTLYRDRETESWGLKDSITPDQDTAVRDLWARAAAGVLECNAEVLTAEVRKALGKPAPAPKAEKPDAKPKTPKADAPAPEAPKPAVVSHANTTIAERIPEVAHESPVECSRRMVNLLFGRPDSALVWRGFGADVRLEEADAAAFIAGLADAGRLQVLAALAKAAVVAVQKLQAAETAKTAENARAIAPVMTKPAPVAVPMGPGRTTGVTVVATAAA